MIEAVILDADIPKYVSYGSMGSIIAHELGHAFDSTNELFSESRRSNHSWNLTTEKEFLKRSRCIADQYSNHTLEELDITVSKIDD